MLALLLSSVGRYAMLFAAGAAAGFYAAWHWKTLNEDAAASKQVTAVIETTKAQDTVTNNASTKGEEHQVEIRYVYNTIVKKVPVYVSHQADRGCVVNTGAVRVLSAAASGVPVLPPAAGQSDDSASGVELSALVGAAAEDLGTCQGIRQQLIDLQGWVNDQRNITR